MAGEDEGEASATVAAAAAAATNGSVDAVDGALFRVPKGLWCYRVDRRRVVLGGALTDGGSVFEWLRSALELSPGEDMDAVMREVEEMPPASHGLVVSFMVHVSCFVLQKTWTNGCMRFFSCMG